MVPIHFIQMSEFISFWINTVPLNPEKGDLLNTNRNQAMALYIACFVLCFFDWHTLGYVLRANT